MCMRYHHTTYAGVAKLVDALDSKSGDGNIVSVRVRPSVYSLHTRAHFQPRRRDYHAP